MWNPGEAVAWRGIFRSHVWHAVSSFAVDDSADALILAVLPGAECYAQEDYADGNKNGKRRWDFKAADWQLKRTTWHTNRFLSITEPDKYYSTLLFWKHDTDEFLGYYVNFQLPFKRAHCGIDSLDLDLDLVIRPDLSFYWKDVEDYQRAIAHGLITPEWMQSIEESKPEIFEKLEKRQYPFDGTWLDWRPDPTWAPPSLPENWDKI